MLLLVLSYDTPTASPLPVPPPVPVFMPVPVLGGGKCKYFPDGSTRLDTIGRRNIDRLDRPTRMKNVTPGPFTQQFFMRGS
jgi:hypothetical protein